MTTTHSASISVSWIAGILDEALSTASDSLRRVVDVTLTQGTGALQYDALYHATETLAASGTTDYDLNGGGLVDRLGNAIAIAELVGILAVNLETTGGIDLQIGAGSNPITSLWAASGDAIKVPAGGHLALLAPREGYAVTAGSADVLRVTNLSGSSTLEYELFLLGRTS